MGIVKENIDFQRGIEPKQAMDLGLMAKWMSIKKDDLLRIKRNFATNSENHLDDNARYHQFKEGDLLDVNISPNKYSDGCIGFTAYIEDENTRSNDDFFMWGTPLEFDQRLEILTGLKESINFERGQDPKDSMKIGRFGERDIKKTLDRLVEIRGGEYKINYIKDWGNRTPYVEGTYFMAPGYNKVFRADNLFIRYYPVQGTSLDYFTYGYRIEGKVMLEKILTTAEEGLKMILSHITVYPHDSASESINFERGLDPKKAMKIGKDFLPYKKGDKVKVWVPWEKRLVEVRVSEDEELDTDNNPKIKKFYSEEKNWEVRRIWVRYNGEVRTANLAIHPENPEQDQWIIHQ